MTFLRRRCNLLTTRVSTDDMLVQGIIACFAAFKRHLAVISVALLIPITHGPRTTTAFKAAHTTGRACHCTYARTTIVTPASAAPAFHTRTMTTTLCASGYHRYDDAWVASV